MKPGPRFTEYELEILRAGRAAGRPYKLIAADLGHTRTERHLREAARARGWAGQLEPRLCAAELEEIRRLAEAGMPLRWIAIKLDRSIAAVCRNARQLGVKSAYLPGQRATQCGRHWSPVTGLAEAA